MIRSAGQLRERFGLRGPQPQTAQQELRAHLPVGRFERRDGGVGQRRHDDRAVKEPFGRGHAPQDRRLAAATRLPEHRDVARVAAEARDVVPHPAQRQHDVLHPQVRCAREALHAHIRQVQEPEGVQPMRERHHDHVVLSRQGFAVVEDGVARSGPEAPAVQPHHHRPAPCANRRRPHVDAQAVFAHRAAAGQHVADLGDHGAEGLGSPRSIGHRVAHSGPRRRRVGRHEAAAAAGRRAIGHTLEHGNARAPRAADAAVGGVDDGSRR